MNNINAITDNHTDNRINCEINHHRYPIQVKTYFTYLLLFKTLIVFNFIIYILNFQDDDTISQKSYGSHKIRSYKDESHKGSADTINGEEKKDASKEELGLEEGK